MELRDYQTKTIDMLYSWFRQNPGNPCVVLPTGAGKSLIIAGFCKRTISDFPGTRILMATHQKELIEQDADKLRQMWPEADIGLYNAALGRRDRDCQVTFGSVQTMYRHPEELGRVDLMLIDECHLVNNNAEGMYRKLIESLKTRNKRPMKVIGLTATPYRLQQGMVTDGGIFSEPLIEPIGIRELQDRGYLSRLTSKVTEAKVSADGVKITSGDYNRKELQEAVDIPGKTEAVIEEVLRRADGRKSWLFFCSGVQHAHHVCDCLTGHGIKAACVTGETPKNEREEILAAFKDGEYTAVTNANVLTTGFDNPRIDLIVMMRPTISPGLYVQMAGRGLRTFPGKENCLVLDFAGNVQMHGPITDVVPPSKKSGRKGIAPSKTCPACGEIIALQCSVCPDCGYEFQKKDESDRKFQLSDADINGKPSGKAIAIRNWTWCKVTTRSGDEAIKVTFWPKDYSLNPVSEWLNYQHSNAWVRTQAVVFMRRVMKHQSKAINDCKTVNERLYELTMRGNCPKSIEVLKKGKYFEITNMIWEEA